MFTAKIVNVESRFGNVDVRVEYSDGEQTLVRDYNFTESQQLEEESLKAFLTRKLNNLNALYEQAQSLKEMKDIELDSDILRSKTFEELKSDAVKSEDIVIEKK